MERISRERYVESSRDFNRPGCCYVHFERLGSHGFDVVTGDMIAIVEFIARTIFSIGNRSGIPPANIVRAIPHLIGAMGREGVLFAEEEAEEFHRELLPRPGRRTGPGRCPFCGRRA